MITLMPLAAATLRAADARCAATPLMLMLFSPCLYCCCCHATAAAIRHDAITLRRDYAIAAPFSMRQSRRQHAIIFRLFAASAEMVLSCRTRYCHYATPLFAG